MLSEYYFCLVYACLVGVLLYLKALRVFFGRFCLAIIFMIWAYDLLTLLFYDTEECMIIIGAFMCMFSACSLLIS